jgi:hypothetical protein
MTIFDQEAIEAAAKVVASESHCLEDNCKVCKSIAVNALTAAEASLRARGMLRNGVAHAPFKSKGIPSREWFAREKQGSYIDEVPVAIIRIAGEGKS